MATTNEKELLRFIGMVNSELSSILHQFCDSECDHNWLLSIDDKVFCANCKIEKNAKHDKDTLDNYLKFRDSVTPILENEVKQQWTESFKYDDSCRHCQAMISHDEHFYAKVLEIGEHKIEAVTFID